MDFRGAVSLVRRVRQFLDITVPVLITRPLRNHQRVRGLGQRCRAAYDLLPVVVRLRGEIMLTFFVDDQSVDFPDDRRGRAKDMLHEGLHIDMGLEGRHCVVGYRWRYGHARHDDCD